MRTAAKYPVIDGVKVSCLSNFNLEAASRFELEMKDLQSSALPLGYAAVTEKSITTLFECVKARSISAIDLKSLL